jgi:hypothetical protein
MTPFDFNAALFQKCSPVSSAFLALSAIVVVIGFGVSGGFSLKDWRSWENRSDVIEGDLTVLGGGDFSFSFTVPFMPFIIEEVRAGGLTDDVADEIPEDLLFGEIDETEFGELIPLW